MNPKQAAELSRKVASLYAMGVDCSDMLFALEDWSGRVADSEDCSTAREFLRLCGGPGSPAYGLAHSLLRYAGSACKVDGKMRVLFGLSLSLGVSDAVEIPQLQCRQVLERLMEVSLGVALGSIRLCAFPVRRAALEAINPVSLRWVTRDLFQYADSPRFLQAPTLVPGRENLLWLGVYSGEECAEEEIFNARRYAELPRWGRAAERRMASELNQHGGRVEHISISPPNNLHAALLLSRQDAAFESIARDIDGVAAERIEFRQSAGRLRWTAMNPATSASASGDALLPDESAAMVGRLLRRVSQRSQVSIEVVS